MLFHTLRILLLLKEYLMAKQAWIAIGYVKYACFVYAHMCVYLLQVFCEPEQGVTAAQLLKDDITLDVVFILCVCTWGCPCLQTF